MAKLQQAAAKIEEIIRQPPPPLVALPPAADIAALARQYPIPLARVGPIVPLVSTLATAQLSSEVTAAVARQTLIGKTRTVVSQSCTDLELL